MVIDIPILFFDGESPDNPGQGAAAAILLMPNGKRFTVSQLLSLTTNQEAEYRGLIIGLEKAKKLGIRQLEVKGASETVFNQMNGLTPISPENLKSLHFEARQLIKHFERVSVEWISATQNRSACAAVKRCIGDALGRESSVAVQDAFPSRILPIVTEFLELGDEATAQDYRNLKLELDEYSLKSLAELRTFIPIEIQDQIALQWNGQEEELSEMYRWYLRGLTAEMAIHKVQIDFQDKIEPIPEKLPWEEVLLMPPLNLLLDDEIEELPPLLDEVDGKTLRASDTAALSLEPIDPETQATFFSLADLATAEISENDPTHAESSLSISSLKESKKDPSKDTLPSTARVDHILEMMALLSPEEQDLLVQTLAKETEWVGSMLKAIAENMTHR